MHEEETGGSDVRRRFAHRCATCGKVVGVLSLVFLAKRLRDRRHEEPEPEPARRRFPIFGH